MTVQVGDAAEHNEKEVKTDYPVEKGLEAGTEKQTGDRMELVAAKTQIRAVDRVGID